MSGDRFMFEPYESDDRDCPLDADGEPLLPDELLLLTSQLRDDAARLAAIYPAAEPSYLSTAPIVSRTAVRRRLYLFGGALSLCVAGLLSVASLVRHDRSASGVIHRFKIPASAEVHRPFSRGVEHSFPVLTTMPPAISGGPSPAFYRLDYSGPEREGLYDLLGTSNDDGISF